MKILIPLLMLIEDITAKYFSADSRGYRILFNYFQKYQDLFRRTIHYEFNDFLNQILLNVSNIKFSENIENIEAYIVGTIKIQCRVQLDKALKHKNRIKIVQLDKSENEDGEPALQNIPDENNGPLTNLESNEIFKAIQYFKATIKTSEVELMNCLIDEKPRKEIAEKINININTLDTQIRRLRIKFIEYLKEAGYKFTLFEKYETKKS